MPSNTAAAAKKGASPAPAKGTTPVAKKGNAAAPLPIAKKGDANAPTPGKNKVTIPTSAVTNKAAIPGAHLAVDVHARVRVLGNKK